MTVLIVSSIAAVGGLVTVVAGAGMQKDHPVASSIIYGGGLVVACLGSLALGMALVDHGYIVFR